MQISCFNKKKGQILSPKTRHCRLALQSLRTIPCPEKNALSGG